MDRPARKSEPERAPESPITFRPCSNGEFCPRPETERDRRAEALFQHTVEENHRRAGMTRRQFAESACGSAAALLVMNQVYGCGGGEGAPADAAVYDVTPDMGVDEPMACERLSGDELIFDVQIHPPSPLNPWRPEPLPTSAEELLRTVFVGSDTSVGCISGIPAARSLGAPNVDANQQLRELVERAAGPRVILHANVDPTRGAAELDYMAEVASRFRVGAWKVYPHVGPWRLDRGVGLGFLERARALGVKVVAAHRGIGPGIGYDASSSPVDVAQAARMFPELAFLTYHSGWDPGASEAHPFDPAEANPVGIDRLVKAVRDAGIGREGNVYAELGSTWRFLMTDPLGAAHALGKLLLHLGEDRILWGTDSVFTGSPQEQIVAFRAFQIPSALQEAHGYPPLTDVAKRKIFGLNAAQVYGVDPEAVRCVLDEDDLGQLRLARRADPRAVPVPTERRYGPRTRREFLAFLRWERATAG
jgi:uncharacterized protein